ncbi:MAG TPA: restriction endonuclease [Candidatus Onthocola stercorigallinarum]|nr:restriction endonuclease [Candidatus Onthocola stercorigallinarum]
MQKKWRKFEMFNKWLNSLDEKKYKIESPGFLIDRVANKRREIDVLITYVDDDNVKRYTAIECKDYKKNIDVRLLEEYNSRKTDLGIDKLIIVSSSNFSAMAKIKASYYGIEIEHAECFDTETDVQIGNFFVDAYFGRWILDNVIFISNKNSEINFGNFIEKLNIIEKQQMYKEFNENIILLPEFDVNTILDNFNKMDIKTLYELDGQLTLDKNFYINEDNFFNKFNIKQLRIKAHLVLLKSTLPLNRSISTFNSNRENENKKFRAFFGIDDLYLDIQYIDKEKVYIKCNFIYNDYRFLTFNMHLNTVLPRESNKNISLDTNIGTFDFSKLQ